ncbi:hypothetical protein F4604DRAFT_1757146 [Suillus subluteus]|nr:hypothetical protein F4604DRAFT_1757146 [Suillus subluteus]
MPVFWLSLASRSVYSLQRSQWTYIPWKLRFILVSLRYSRSCRCLCWDHASSSVFEDITPGSWPTLIQQPL